VSLNDKAKAQLAALKQRQAEAQQREAELQARLAAERAERERFAREVGTVTRMPHTGRADLRKPPPQPHPKQREADEAQALASTLSDELDVSTLLHTDDGLSYCRSGVQADVLPRLRKGHWSIQRQLDLHGQTRDQARESLAQFIRQASREGLRCVRVVHGKGHGSPGKEPVLKHKVRAWLVQKAEVMAFTQAPATEGGHGAVLVLLG
jgi:DNA-nicking Smr family endonuclease